MAHPPSGYMTFSNELEEATLVAAKSQPRQGVNQSGRRALPHADPSRQQQSSLFQIVPLDCRLLIWECVLHRPQTRIERWRPFLGGLGRIARETYGCDADCFPYRLTTAGYGKIEKPLNLLLCCRQLYLEGLSILYSTTLVFEMPIDLFSFRLCVSPEGLSSITSLIIAFGQVDWPCSGPFNPPESKPHPGALQDWQGAILGLGKLSGLKSLHIWLGHCHVQMPALERRPWQEHQGSVKRERNHSTLFGLFGILKVPDFTIHLTWKPEDLLAQRNWSFKVQLHTKDEMMDAIAGLPPKTERDFYGRWT